MLFLTNMTYLSYLLYLIVVLSIFPSATYQRDKKPHRSKTYEKFKEIEDCKSILNVENRLRKSDRNFCLQKQLYCMEDQIKRNIKQIIDLRGSKVTNFNQELLKIWENFIIKDKKSKMLKKNETKTKHKTKVKEMKDKKTEHEKQLKKYKKNSRVRISNKISHGLSRISKILKIPKKI